MATRLLCLGVFALCFPGCASAPAAGSPPAVAPPATLPAALGSSQGPTLDQPKPEALPSPDFLPSATLTTGQSAPTPTAAPPAPTPTPTAAPPPPAPSPPAAATPTASVRLGAFAVSGGAMDTKANLTRVLVGMMAGFRRCANKALAEDAKSIRRGAVTVTAQIGPDGGVISAFPSTIVGGKAVQTHLDDLGLPPDRRER